MTAVGLLNRQSLWDLELAMSQRLVTKGQTKAPFLSEQPCVGKDKVFLTDCREAHGQISSPGVKCLLLLAPPLASKFFFLKMAFANSLLLAETTPSPARNVCT